MKSSTLINAVAVAAATLTVNAFGEERGPSAYLGLGGSRGNAQLPASAGRIGNTSVQTASSQANASGTKLYVGYRFSPTWGTEFSYADLGKKYSDTLTTPTGSSLGGAKLKAWSWSGTGSFELLPHLWAVGKLGIARDRADVDTTCVGTTCTAPRKNSSWSPVVGAGAEVGLGNYGLRLEYEDYGKFSTGDVLSTGNSGSIKAHAVTLSLQTRF